MKRECAQYDEAIEKLEHFVNIGLNEGAFYLITPAEYLDKNCFDFRDGRYATAGNLSAKGLDDISGDALIKAINKLTKENSSEDKIPAGLSRFIRRHGLYDKFAVVIGSGEKYSAADLSDLADAFTIQEEALEE